MVINTHYYTVSPVGFAAGLLGWKVTRRLEDHTRKLIVFPDKLAAVIHAVDECTYWMRMGYTCELKIKNKWSRTPYLSTYMYRPERGNG